MSRLKSKKGQGLVEYVLMLVLMGVLAIGSLKFLGEKTHDAFSKTATQLDTQTSYADGNVTNTGIVSESD